MFLPRRTGFTLGAALLLAGLAAGSFGCELIANVDRSKVEDAGGTGGSGGSGGTGGSPACKVATDCPDQGSECASVACNSGVCEVTSAPDGTPVMMQTAGDCQSVQCDGAGKTKSVNDDTDVDDDTNPCTVDTCAAGVSKHDPAPAGTSCGTDLKCDDMGACVGCVMPTDCPGVDDDCQKRTCDAGKCGTMFVASGTAVSMQTAGDCHEDQCDGSGKVTSVMNDMDLPADGSSCTADVCTAGVPSNPPLMAGIACNDMGGNVCSGMGACVECNTASQCAGMDTECQVRTCNNHVCGVMNTAAGTAVSMQTPGDCKVAQCNGGGSVEIVPQDTDKPDDSNPCTNDICTAGVPSHTNQMQGTSCGGTSQCDANGACVGCLMATDCPGMDNACQTRTCTSGMCGFNFVASGTPIAMQTAGDCKVSQCNGMGQTVVVADNNDKPNDNNQCTDDACNAGVPSNDPSTSGTACTQMMGTVCNGAGACVKCVANADCTSQTMGACVANVCQAPSCMDGIKNGTETDVDCGGSCPTQCALTKGCSSDNDCSSGSCTMSACALLNGCDKSTAVDATANTMTTITFANGNFSYLPKCVKVKVNSDVIFSGNFVNHPLLGGVVANNMATPAASGPFVPVTNMGTMKTFTMSTAGTFPYYCTVHAVSANMDGVVYVVP